MSYPPICDQVRPSAQRSTRTGRIVRHIWHHQAGTNDDATIDLMVSGRKQVSANTTVSNTGRITGVVDMDYCAWTSSSRRADGQAHTTEVANSSGAPEYGISEETYAACALLAVYDYYTLGIPLKRATKEDPTGHMGHNEVLYFFGEGYPTACPLHLDIDRIIRDAIAIVNGPVPGDEEMQFYTVTNEKGGLNGSRFGLYPGGFTVFEETEYWAKPMAARYGKSFVDIAEDKFYDELNRLNIPRDIAIEYALSSGKKTAWSWARAAAERPVSTGSTTVNTPPVDLDKLADKVADKLAARLAS